MEPPPELLMPLLPYQKEFLAWAIKQEQSDIRGGCGPIRVLTAALSQPWLGSLWYRESGVGVWLQQWGIKGVAL